LTVRFEWHIISAKTEPGRRSSHYELIWEIPANIQGLPFRHRGCWLKGDKDEKFQLAAIYHIVDCILSSSHSLPNLLPSKTILTNAQFVGHSLATADA
jgi:hypothetical protein